MRGGSRSSNASEVLIYALLVRMFYPVESTARQVSIFREILDDFRRFGEPWKIIHPDPLIAFQLVGYEDRF
jgi:hypothetical protein